ncbi:glycosyltransferase [Gramella sp. GC03-9]|uniref:Glycosyltransferase n=1 Tax=Christiangramia oceanisediminis TaxID=2920386 RepID=A0A9X2KX69_9FLAO|nr:glycosyltransferase [Gramella oceanisediminis]
MKNPKVSIIITCYNDPDIIKAVESAANQTYSSKEIIVIDDGSNDEIKDLIANLKENVDLIITQENKGQSKARNNAIKSSSGEFILNLDSDDYFESSFAEKAVKKLIENKDYKVITCKARRFDKNGTIDIFTPSGGRIDSFLFSNAALGSSMFRKIDWERVGGYEEELPILGFEDWDFYIKILKEAGSAFVLNEVLFNYQVRPGNTTSRIRNQRVTKFKLIVKNHPELYREHHVALVGHLFKRLKRAEEEKNRRENSFDYQLGNKILMPFRSLKRILWNKK